MGTSTETAVLDYIREADNELAQKIMDNMFSFDDLKKVDDKGLFSYAMFKRMNQSEWADNICEDLRPVLHLLESQWGVKVVRIGLENVKAPETVVNKNGGGMPAQFRGTTQE